MASPMGGDCAGDLELELDDLTAALPIARRPVAAPLAFVPGHTSLARFSPVFPAPPTAQPPAHYPQQSAPPRRIPGPAGQGIGWPANMASTAGVGTGTDADFCSSAWLSALDMLDLSEFDAHSPLLRGTSVRTARSMKASGVLPRLLVFVVSVQRAYNGECLIQLKDPSGAIAGTLTSDVLEHDPDIRRGSVLLLQKVTMLRTPPPGALHHLCITPENIAQVIAAGQGPLPTGAAAAVPALPAPLLMGRVQPLQAEPAHGGQQYQQQMQAMLPQQQQQQQVPPPSPPQPSNVDLGGSAQRMLDDTRNLGGFRLVPAKSQPAVERRIAPIDNGIDDLLAGLDEEFAL